MCLNAKKSNVDDASIGSGGIGMSRPGEISAVSSCTEASGWGLRVCRYDVPRQLT